MTCNRLLICKNYVLFAGLMVLMVMGILIWILNLRLVDFSQHQLDITHESLTGVEKQVAYYVAEKQRMVEVFVHENIHLISALVNDSDNDKLHQALGKQLSLYFPDRFAFSIADKNGNPLFEDFDGLVSELCVSDIKQFSIEQHSYLPYIHPNSEGYHFDIMVRYGKGKTAGVFFVSFLADILGDIVKNIQGPYQKIMLIYPKRNNLIEVVAEGARNHELRDDYRLSEQEQSRISMRHDIAGTRWQAIDFYNDNLYSSFRNKLIQELAVIFVIFTAIAILFVIRLRREEWQRELLEQQKKALMSVVSHEFRSPTSVIKTALEQVASGMLGEIKGEVKEFVEIALNSTSRLLLLVDDFLDIQNIESGNLKLDKQETQLSSLVIQSVTNNQLYAEQFGTRYHLQEPLSDEHVNCDANRIEQVLINFLTNAAKYGLENGIVDVAVTRHNKYLRVSVSNLGEGIPADFRGRVFDKFAMAYAPKKEQKIKSSGLGLSIAKGIIEQHGGNIGFESETGKSTTFWFELEVLK